MGQRENRVQAACITILELAGCFVWRANTGTAMLRGKGGKMRPVSFGINGQPDIQGMIGRGPHRGRFIGVECKAPAENWLLGRKRRAGVQSDDQIEWQRRCEAAGGLYLCLDSSLTLEAKLKELGAM